MVTDNERRKAERRIVVADEPEEHSHGSDDGHGKGFEVSWVVVVASLIGLFAWGWANLHALYSDLDRTKLDKGVFEEHQRSITGLREDIKLIREDSAHIRAVVERHRDGFGYRGHIR